MTKQDDTQRKSRRDLLLILLILPLGFLCMFMAGQVAIRLAPSWAFPFDIGSNLDPNLEYALATPPSIGRLNPNILTQPPWGNSLFLTPGASIPTRKPTDAPPPPPARTPRPTEIDTPIPRKSPTATLSGPFIPTVPGRLYANLELTKTDNSGTYTPGTSISYTIVVTNNGPDNAFRFNIQDNIPAAISGLTVTCTPANSCGTNTSSGNTVSFRDASLYLNITDQLIITVSGQVASGATGNLSNTAEVIVPRGAGYWDPYDPNNTDTDRDTQLSIYDIAITKSDPIDVYTAATTQFNYTVTVSNSGPSDAFGVIVNDSLPAGIASWSWQCATVNNASGCNGVTNSTSNFSDTVTIRSGGSIQYSVAAILATVTPPQNPLVITNTASVTIPNGPGTIQEQNPGNNSAVDVNNPDIDLEIVKDDLGATFQAGGMVDYTVTVINNSTFDLTGITVSDPKPTQIADWVWCISPPCPAPINTDFTDSIALTAGSSLTYNVSATVSGNPGLDDISNTASVSPPAGLVDTDTSNNSSIAITPPYIDLSIEKTSLDAPATYSAGGTVTYQVTVTNNGAFDLTGITVSDPKPAQIATWGWCVAPCTPDPNSINTDFTGTIDLSVGGSVQYNVAATIIGNPGDIILSDLVNTATVSPPTGLVDSNPGDNSSSFTHATSTTSNVNIGLPDGNVISPPGGTTSTFIFSPAIMNNGNNTPDFVFYERDTGSGIAMDVVIVEISQNGNTWSRVFNWGDNVDDFNTNVSLSIIGDGGDPANPEYDDRDIPYSDLYNNTGITIDIDSLGLSGSYPWIRFICPATANNTDNMCDIDAIQPYYP